MSDRTNGDDDEDDEEFTEEELADEEDPPAEVQAEFEAQLDQYERDLRAALEEKLNAAD